MTVRYFLVFIALLHGSSSSLAAPVAVRFVEGVTHAFLVLGKANGPALASGDFLQIARGGKVESRTVFHFKDGSLFDESVTFTQHGVFKMPSYQLLRRGPAFTEDAQIWLGQPAGKYRVKTKVHKDGREDVLNGTIDLPQDVYNGMVVTVAKNLPKGSGETVHVVAFMPKPRLMQLELAPTTERQVRIGELARSVSVYLFRPQLGTVSKAFARLLGRLPPDCEAWISRGEIPVVLHFEGPLYAKGPVWRIEVVSPSWSH